MKKFLKFLGKALGFLVAFIVGIILGFALIIGLEGGFEGGISFWFEFVIAFIISFSICTIVHEGGHLVFGLISGYGFSSFRIGSLMLLLQNGKLRVCSYSLAGTGGQCLMTPPEGKEGKKPVILYNLGGVIFNFVFALVCALLFFLLPYVYILSLTLLICGLVSVAFVFMNGIPMHVSGIANDGMNALGLSKDEKAAEAFFNQLRMNEAQVRGVRLRDMPDEWFIIPDGVDKKNVNFASIAVFAVNRSFDNMDTERSEREIEELLHSEWGIIGLHRNLLLYDLVYCRLINRGSDADVSELFTPEMKNFTKAMKNYPSVIRTEYALALVHKRDEKEAEKIKKRFEKRMKKSPSPTETEFERTLMKMARDRYENTKIEA